MEHEPIWDLAGDVSPDKAYQLGRMVAAMIEAGLDETANLALLLNLRAFRRGLRSGLSSLSLEGVPLHLPYGDAQFHLRTRRHGRVRVMAKKNQVPWEKGSSDRIR